MENLDDYIKRAGLDSWEEHPADELDFAAFSQIVYLPLDIALTDDHPLSLEEISLAMAGLTVDNPFSIFYRKRLELMREMARQPRYRHITLEKYEHDVKSEVQKQFCAVTFTLPGNIKALCFEGTDLSLAGWKEDFNMSFESPVPAQSDACRYLQRAAGEDQTGSLVLLGHSKGGNLAVYASAFAPPHVQERIKGIYSYDGPGLMAEDVRSPGYQAICARIFAYLPQNSLVGILMCRHDESIIIKSSALGVFQHDLFSWKIKKEETIFYRIEELSGLAQLRDEVLSTWLHDISLEDREKFSDAVYQVLSADENRQTVGDLFRFNYQYAILSLKALKDIDLTTRKMIRRLLKTLFSETVDTVVENAKDALMEIPGKIRDKMS